MARSFDGVGSWWPRTFRAKRAPKWFAHRAKRASAKPRAYDVRLLGCELLEDRALLALDSAAAWADFSALQFDPNDYDPSHVLVRFDNNVVGANHFLQTLDNGAFRDVEIAAPLPLVPGLQRIRLTGGQSVEAALAALRGDPPVFPSNGTSTTQDNRAERSMPTSTRRMPGM
jgi:hypothetical protein